jgi:hypothetical protein
MEMNLLSSMKMNTLLVIIGLLVSCTENKTPSETYANDISLAVTDMEHDMKLRSASGSNPAELAEVTDRKLIRNGDLEFKTDEVKKTKAEIEKICKEFSAYISSESENNYGDRLQYNQQIRVPANEFDALIKRIEPLAIKIKNKNIHTQDVTEEFIDVEARLKTKKELETRYREILKQAKTVQDIVSIEGQIGQVRSEIESMEGRLKYLRNQVAYSTLNVTYYETIGTDFGFAAKLVESLTEGWGNLLSFVIFLFQLWPFVMGLSVAVAWWWKRRAKNKSGV